MRGGTTEQTAGAPPGSQSQSRSRPCGKNRAITMPAQGRTRRQALCLKMYEMAETKGFEPSRRFPACTLSRGVPSTTRPRLRRCVYASAEGETRAKTVPMQKSCRGSLCLIATAQWLFGLLIPACCVGMLRSAGTREWQEAGRVRWRACSLPALWIAPIPAVPPNQTSRAGQTVAGPNGCIAGAEH